MYYYLWTKGWRKLSLKQSVSERKQQRSLGSQSSWSRAGLESSLNEGCLEAGLKRQQWKIYTRLQGTEGFPGGSDGKESTRSAADPTSIPGLGRSSGEGNGNPLQYSCLENPRDRGAWQATVCGVAKRWTWFAHTNKRQKFDRGQQKASEQEARVDAMKKKKVSKAVSFSITLSPSGRTSFVFKRREPREGNWASIIFILCKPWGFPEFNDWPRKYLLTLKNAGTSLKSGEENGNPLQYSCLENPMDEATWLAKVHGAAKNWTWLSDEHFHYKKESVTSKCILMI